MSKSALVGYDGGDATSSNSLGDTHKVVYKLQHMCDNIREHYNTSFYACPILMHSIYRLETGNIHERVIKTQ